MSLEIRMSHGLTSAEAAERVRLAAQKHDLVASQDASSDGPRGELAKETPLGSVRAQWEATDSEVIVAIQSKPAFLPEGTIRRLLEENLREALQS